MKINTTNNIMRSAFLFLVSLVASVAAVADNQVRIENFSIVPGSLEGATVSVVMDNTDKISSLQFDMVLPEGLDFVDDSAERNTARMTKTSHTLSVTDFTYEDGYTVKRVSIFARARDEAKTAISGNTGEIFTFMVTASPKFTGGKISLKEVIGSDATVAPAVEKVMVDTCATVKADAGSFVLSPESASLTFAKKDTVNFYLNDNISVVGLEAKLSLPEGVEVDDVLYGDRLSENATVTYVAKTGKILIESMTNDELSEDKSLPVFSIVLKSKVVTTGKMTLADVLVSNGTTAFAVEGTPSVDVTVIDINKITYEALKPQYELVRDSLDKVLDVIRNYTTEAGKAWADSEEADALVNDLTEAGLYLEADYQAGTLDETYALYAALDVYNTRIADLEKKAADAEAKAKIIIGDVNGDGNITIADANMIVNYFLGSEPEGFVIDAADVNGDGNITIADANAVVNMFLNN